ncbi:MAG TPA: GNAT family N-acetyltransferase [archaeon]|nr:GNAT family N-acetyltransferase [archaeon]
MDFESEHQNSSKHVSRKDMKRKIKNRFDEGHELFFGYRQDNELVGYVTLKPFFPGYKHCEIYWLAVKKKCQGQGIGTKLMRFIEKYAKKNGFRKVCLYTGQNMKLTKKFYEKIGYKLVNKFPRYYGYPTGNTTAILYAKEI